MGHSAQPNLAFLRLATVRAQTGLSRSTIYARVKIGTFPAPVKIGARASAWLAEEIEAWQRRQIADSRAAVAEGGRNHADAP